MHYIDLFFFFNDTATTEIYTLSLHDALPIFSRENVRIRAGHDRSVSYVSQFPTSWVTDGDVTRLLESGVPRDQQAITDRDRKSTRLNSSHANISYAVFCLKKKKTIRVRR